MMEMRARYKKILKETRPYLIGNPRALDKYNQGPFGANFLAEDLMSCLDGKNGYFFELLQRLDSLTFGHQGMGMDKWVFFDCAAMPSGIFGFGLLKKDLPEDFLKMLRVEESYEGLVPVSMFMAIPTSDEGRWFAHNLSSLNSFIGSRFPGLGLFTKAFGCQVFGIEKCYGATQWGSAALEIHTQLGDMRLKAAWLPAHTHENSLCYLSDYKKENLLRALSEEKRTSDQYDLLVEASDSETQQKLQRDIERGLQISIVGRPIKKDKETFYPIRFIES